MDAHPEGLLENRLKSPGRTVTPQALADSWFMGRAVLTVAGFAADVPLVQLAGRIRGALGTVLRQGASPEAVAGQPCPWQRPCALDVLYRTQGYITPGLEIPKPYVLSVERDGDLLRVELGLVGLASDWLEEATAALALAWRRHLPDARGSQIVDRVLLSSEGVAVPQGAEAAVMDFRSPLELRFRDGAPLSAGAALASLMASLGNRISGLARWQDATVDADWTALKAAAGRVEATVLAHDDAVWQRHSSRQRRWIPMRGDRPVLLLQGDLQPFLPWLAIGAEIHAGSHAALGMGRYRLHVPE